MSVFLFKQFNIKQEISAMKVGTDAMLLGSLVRVIEPATILDVGAGTGVLALMMAQRFSEAKIQAIEVDTASAQEAQYNFDHSPWKDRLKTIEADFLSSNFEHSFDLIISNPPYYQSRLENDDPRKSQARHESALPMKAMLEKVANLLTDEGSFWVIVPAEVCELWIRTAAASYLECATIISIFGKEGGEMKRTILEFKAHSVKSLENKPESRCDSSITIRNTDGSYTDQYIDLTKAFHYNSLK